MATDFGGRDITRPGKANTAVTQFACLLLASTGVEHTTANNSVPFGWAQEGFAALGVNVQPQVPVRVAGTTKAISSGVIAPGTFTSPAASGLVVAHAAATNSTAGISMAIASTANNDIFPLLICQGVR